MTCAACSGSIENHLGNAVEGIQSVNVSLLTNKAIVRHDLDKIRPRKIIEEVEDLGFEAELLAGDESVDVRSIVRSEMLKYRLNFLVALALYSPMVFFIWVMPYVDGLKPFMTEFDIVNGTTIYVFINGIVSSVIQFVLGRNFYVSAYKSLKHKSANMDVLIVIGTTSAWLYGLLLIGIGYTEEDQEGPDYHK